MAEPVTVARPYAEAVFKLAREKDDLAAWSSALSMLEALVKDPQVAALIGDPNVSAQQLETLISATHSNAGASLAGYLGQQVEIDSAGAAWDGQPVHWRYNLPAASASTTVTVTDAAGHVVYSKTGELGEGDHDFEWDGSLNDGTTAKSGTPYWISVVAEDADLAHARACQPLPGDVVELEHDVRVVRLRRVGDERDGLAIG